ncbi:MAG TPA: cupin domain-containing protein [Vicinamibacterales bacterium]|nr:cupin domain-containing protein [Vicinamibacterales bacterium]
MTWATARTAILGCTLALWTAPVWAQAVAGPEKARPVAGDPGISSMVVIDQAPFRVLRDYAEPGAVRRMHNHADATYHVFVLITGQLQLTVQGEPMIEVRPGEALTLKGGAMHTFTNSGTVAATIVEVFGKAPAAPGDVAAFTALAEALARGAQGR